MGLLALDRARVAAQLDLVSQRVHDLELLACTLCAESRVNVGIHLDAPGLQVQPKLLHVRWLQHQAEVVHIRGGAVHLRGWTQVQDDLRGHAHRNEPHLPLAELLFPEDVQAHDVPVEREQPVDVLGLDDDVVQALDLHTALHRPPKAAVEVHYKPETWPGGPCQRFHPTFPKRAGRRNHRAIIAVNTEDEGEFMVTEPIRLTSLANCAG